MKKTIHLIILLTILFGACEKVSEQDELPVSYEIRKGIYVPGTNGYNIYPRPFNNQVNFDLEGSNVNLLLSDESGRAKNIELKNNSSIRVDFSKCKVGVYYCEITLDGVVYRERLWKNQ